MGQAQSVANFVEGWAPAVLELGASGYIGGMWPLVDRAAAEFAERFYTVLERKLTYSGRASIAAAPRESRRLFYEKGDPTFLAYTYYGDVYLRFTRNRKAPAQIHRQIGQTGTERPGR